MATATATATMAVVIVAVVVATKESKYNNTQINIRRWDKFSRQTKESRWESRCEAKVKIKK